MIKLSQTVLEKSANVIKAIKEHPFNRELAAGSLDMQKFGYYIEQDTVYLRDFARALTMIAAKAPQKFMKDFLAFSEGVLITEQKIVHSFFRKTFHFQETKQLTLATFAYTHYLLYFSMAAPVEVAIAAILPCFWVYQIVGQFVAETTHAKSSNPYWRWIETYSSQEFDESVQRAIAIFDEVALSASDEIRGSMIDAFYKSTVLEWHFWNDSYNLSNGPSLL